MSGYGGKRCGEIMIRYEEEQLRNMSRSIKEIRSQKKINSLKTTIKSIIQ